MAVAMRFEMTGEVFEEIYDHSLKELDPYLGTIFPGMGLTPPRKEGDVTVFEMTVPDEVMSNDMGVVVARISLESESAYNYNLERRFAD